VVAVSTDRKDGVAMWIKPPAQAKSFWASISSESFRHLHHDTPCG
jgi:hypothetical protein